MSKLTLENKFIDVSDYGRPMANIIAEQLKDTRFTAIHLTLLFGFSGVLAICCMLTEYYWAAGFFLILKSILDAADGQLARVKNQPSFTGRYLDSIFDSILNLALLICIGWITATNVFITLAAYLCMQTQGTLYNYYHVVFRHGPGSPCFQSNCLAEMVHVLCLILWIGISVVADGIFYGDGMD